MKRSQAWTLSKLNLPTQDQPTSSTASMDLCVPDLYSLEHFLSLTTNSLLVLALTVPDSPERVPVCP